MSRIPQHSLSLRSHLRLWMALLGLSSLCLLPGCGDGGSSSSHVIPYPAVTRFHYIVTNNMRMPITTVVIDGMDKPVKFDSLAPGQTKRNMGPAEKVSNKIEVSWTMPDGSRKYQAMKFKSKVPASFNGEIHLIIEDLQDVDLKIGTYPEPG